MSTPHLSVVMPALNEADNIDAAIEEVLQGFDRFGIDGELVVINDGSTDATPGKIAEWRERDSRVHRVDHARPQGIGQAFWDGVDVAAGLNVVMLPGDNENDPDEIFRYVSLLDHVDVVIPFIYNIEMRSIFRNILSQVYRAIINITFRTNFNYTNGTILYRRSLLKQLDYRSRSFFFQTDILVRLIKAGYLFAEVPYRINQREKGESKALSLPSLWKVMRGYLHLVQDIYCRKNVRREYPKDSMTNSRRG
ncbi:MAG TPA: glycosyltransferase family 2 protein [Desulfovibrio sp.]|uniref:glycosyltransferase family 2 protein n=1 Tax=Desulfovibrio sp. TaxID=885 RepID=UPI002C47A7D9|nr:glycosyltransferase family 2 protein [Desulfovibrio sp.]HMM39177.1 glycosyltransferase family 2 protein [Desulfovibrio sp.]